MLAFAALPLLLQLSIVCLCGLILGALVNWATYNFAWFNPQEISPWGSCPPQATRRWTDRIPVLGWLGLRREHEIHGRGFWIRPMLIEIAMGIGLAWLYCWEVQQQQLIIPQVAAWFQIPLLTLADVAPTGWTQATFLNHALLITLMAAASFIDIDEKIIPDTITVPGTLLGLTLAALIPMGLLPHVDLRTTPEITHATIALPPVAQAAVTPGKAMYLEPVTLAAPSLWPVANSDWRYLVVGQLCWWLWCFALTPRILHTRHGLGRGLAIVLRRVVRELTRSRLAIIAWLGSAAVAAAWWLGGTAWLGLLTSLVGLVVSGGLVWGIRIAGSAALQREAMGFGDVTLMMMVGTFLGWQAGIIIFFIAPFTALVVGIIQLISRSDDVIPYGPFLCLGALFVMVRWADIWNRTQLYFQIGWLVPAVLIVCIFLLGFMLAVWQQIKIRLFKI